MVILSAFGLYPPVKNIQRKSEIQKIISTWLAILDSRKYPPLPGKCDFARVYFGKWLKIREIAKISTRKNRYLKSNSNFAVGNIVVLRVYPANRYMPKVIVALIQTVPLLSLSHGFVFGE